MHITIKQDHLENPFIMRNHYPGVMTYEASLIEHHIKEIKLFADRYQMLHITIFDLTNNTLSKADARCLKKLFLALKACPYLISVQTDWGLITPRPGYSKLTLKLFNISLVQSMATDYLHHENNLAAMQCYALLLKKTPLNNELQSRYQHVSNLLCKDKQHVFNSERNNTCKLMPLNEVSLHKDNVTVRGGFSTVHLGFFKTQPVAIKQIHINTHKAHEWDNFQNEYQIHQALNHPCIVKLLGVCIEIDFYCLIQKPVLNGTLSNNIEQKNLSLSTLWLIVHDISSALEYMHQENIVHNDIKPQNILLTDNNRAKLIDFGFSTPENTCHSAGTVPYLAPELLNPSAEPHKNIHTKATDIYSFGMVIGFMFSKKTPFSEEPNLYNIMRRIKEGPKEKIAESTPDSMKAIIKSCRKNVALNRPQASNLKEIAKTEYSKLEGTEPPQFTEFQIYP